MYWKRPVTDLEHTLTKFLDERIYSICMNKPAGPEAARLHSLRDFIAELEDGGIQLEGFKTTRREDEGPDRFDPRAIHVIYTITCGALPASECFVCIDCKKKGSGKYYTESSSPFDSPVQFYARVYDALTYSGQAIGNDNFSLVFRFLEHIEKIAAESLSVRARFEKRQKVKELAQDSIKTWFAQICGELDCAYSIHLSDIQAKLYAKINDKAQLEIAVPYSKFQQIMPELKGLIQVYMAMAKNSKVRMSIRNFDSCLFWREPGKKQTEEEYLKEKVKKWARSWMK